MASTPATERIRAAAEQRAALLQRIAATQHAKGALDDMLPAYLDLQKRRAEARTLYGRLSVAARDKQKEIHDREHHSHLRRLLQREKHLAELKQTRADYIEALGWQDKAKIKMDLMDREFDALRQTRTDLRELEKEHRLALIALDDLYASVFDGPSPDLPEEDELEAAVQAAQEAYDAVQTRLSHAADVVNHLSKARMSVGYALNCVGEALKASSQDIAGTNGIYGARSGFSSGKADWTERMNLAWVQRSLAEAEHYMAAAQQMDPHVGDYFRPQVADVHSTTAHLDEFLNNPLTDYLFHREIESTSSNVRACATVLDREIRLADERRAAVEREKAPVQAALDEGRRRLLDLRQDLFERALRAHEGKPEAQLPPYDDQPAGQAGSDGKASSADKAA